MNECRVEMSAEHNIPHRGKRIQTIVCSPNFKYVATFSKEGKDVFMYPVNMDKISALLNYAHSINSNDSNDDKILNDVFELIAVSDCKHIIVETYKKNETFHCDFKLIDIVKKKPCSLVEGIQTINFLDNGDVAFIKGELLYIYSKSKIQDEILWICKNKIELSPFIKCFIFPKGKLLLVTNIPFMITQFDLKTLAIEAQYLLNWDMYDKNSDIYLELNNNNTLLAMDDMYIIKTFSTENGMLIAEDNECSFYEHKYFITSEEGECLILQKGECFFITDPCRLNNKVNADKLFQLDGNEFNEYYKVNNLFFGKEIERHLKEPLGLGHIRESSPEDTFFKWNWSADQIKFKLLENKNLMAITTIGAFI
ncbi:25181_t:CDS:2 [Racocetra persica]|uniref:25181_t:CDS:1 n=1 Tax=Racocetra persica TaxID=160502 RepID=A0ACA9M5G7_9GLOM|nr:25181_t:CDS:2 [Racocetra persica]